MSSRGVFHLAELRILAELFSAKNLRDVAWYGTSELLAASRALLKVPSSETWGLGRVFDRAFDVLRRDYPVEYVFKSGLLARLLFGRHSPRTTSFYPEFQIGEARADVLLVNGAAAVFEIKTRYDSPDRLQSQLDEYYRCVPFVTVVTDTTMVEEYLGMLPDYVGVATLTPALSMQTKRAPTRHLLALDYEALFSMLRQKEYRRIVRSQGVNLLAADPAEEHELGLDAFKRMPMRLAQQSVIAALRSRQVTERIADRCSRLPTSLHAAAFSYRLRSVDWERIMGVMSRHPTETPIQCTSRTLGASSTSSLRSSGRDS